MVLANYPPGGFLAGAMSSSPLYPLFCYGVVRDYELIEVVVLVRKSVVVCPSRRAGDHQECPVEGADDLVVKPSTVVLAAV